MRLKPFFTFYGGKWRVSKYYPSPIYKTIIEPFAGSAGYSLSHYSKKIILCDKDEKIAATWNYLLKVTPEEILDLPDIEPYQMVDDLKVCPEAKLLIGWWCNKGCVQPMKSPSAWMREGKRKTSFWGQAIKQRIASQVDLIRHWKFIYGGYDCLPNITATWFIDPPYQKSGKYYRYGSRQIDYRGLANFCQNRIGQIIVCEQEGANWLPFDTFIRAKGNESKHGGKISKEAIWSKKT